MNLNKGLDEKIEEEFQEMEYAKEPGYFDRNPIVRVLVALFLIGGIFLFLQMKEIRVDVLELHSTAQKYVVSQVDFDFLDDEETLILRQEAIRDIGKIYKLLDKEVQERRLELEKNLIHDQSWKKFSEHTTVEDLYKAVDMLADALIKSRFTDARTLSKLKEMHLAGPNYYLFIPLLDTQIAVDLPQKVWVRLKTMAILKNPLPKGTLDYIFDFFKEKSWHFTEDTSAYRSLKKNIQATIPEKYTHVSAGSRIIDQGEKVTSRHIAMLQAMKEKLGEERNLWHPLTVFGSLLLSIAMVLVGSFYLRVCHQDVFLSNKKLFLLSTVVLITLLLAKITEYFLLKNTSHLIDFVRYPLFVPFAAILVCSLMNARISIFTSAFLAILLNFGLQIDRSGFFVINLIPALVAVLSMASVHRRKEVFIVCSKAWFASLVLVLGLDFSEGTNSGIVMLGDITSTLAFMVATGIFVVGFLPIFEYLFSMMTDITLMEYMDPTNELLRRLMVEAPGTYQHSVVVGNLAEAAAMAIGANGLFCRVSTQYHDIGKLIAPQYFTENQQGGINMHQLLTPLESSQVIISHVSEGVAMARKAGLPESFISIIKEHHGTTLVYYFYHKQIELMGGDGSLVSEKEFRYMGPKPRSKESAIIMIADSLEAAARSLDDFTVEAIGDLVERIVSDKAEDGQFNDCQLTFEELKIVKNTIIQTLVASAHARIKYPKKRILNV